MRLADNEKQVVQSPLNQFLSLDVIEFSHASYHLQLVPICVLWKHLQAPKSISHLSIANMLENPAQVSCV